jgi:hypothetical protein
MDFNNFDLSISGFIYDLISLLTIFIILHYLYKKNTISYLESTLLLIFCSTPLFFNEVLFHWALFPDQSKYLTFANQFRHGMFEFGKFSFDDPFLTVKVASLFFAMFPVLTFSSVNSIAFINKIIVVYLFIFFKNKKVNKIVLFSLIFLPSVILYSSLSLRDILIMALMLLGTYNYFEKKHYSFILIILFLSLIKFYNSILLLIILVSYTFLFEYKNNIIKYLLLIPSLFLIIVNLETILSLLNNYRLGFFSEINSNYSDRLNSLNNEDRLIKVDFESFINIILIYLKSFLYPITSLGVITITKIILYIDNLFFSILYFVFCFVRYKENKQKIIFWLFFYILINIILSLVAINEITFLRYKMSWAIFFLYVMDHTTKKIK